MPILTLFAVQSQIASCMPEALKAETQAKFAAEGYALAGTQVVCNPRSYPGEATRFDPWSLLRGEHRADSEGLADSNCTAHNRQKVKPDGWDSTAGIHWRRLQYFGRPYWSARAMSLRCALLWLAVFR